MLIFYFDSNDKFKLFIWKPLNKPVEYLTSVSFFVGTVTDQ